MKSQTYPETVPAKFSHEILSAAYRRGWNRGHGIACHNVPELGAKLFSDSLGRVTVDAENIREVHQDACFASEMNSRDFSPFEFLAHELNGLGEGTEDSPSSDKAWAAYEEGVADSIFADLETYSDEDYGIAAS
jgi:hypothetical protein